MFDFHHKLNHIIYSNLYPGIENEHRIATSGKEDEQLVKICTNENSCRVSIRKKDPSKLPPLKYYDYDKKELNLQVHLGEIAVQLALLRGNHSSHFHFHLIDLDRDYLLVSMITKIQDRICFFSEIRPHVGHLVELLRFPSIEVKGPYPPVKIHSAN